MAPWGLYVHLYHLHLWGNVGWPSMEIPRLCPWLSLWTSFGKITSEKRRPNKRPSWSSASRRHWRMAGQMAWFCNGFVPSGRHGGRLPWPLGRAAVHIPIVERSNRPTVGVAIRQCRLLGRVADSMPSSRRLRGPRTFDASTSASDRRLDLGQP
jgi:hypothetical protein